MSDNLVFCTLNFSVYQTNLTVNKYAFEFKLSCVLKCKITCYIWAHKSSTKARRFTNFSNNVFVYCLINLFKFEITEVL